MDTTMHALHKGNVGIVVLLETKLTRGIHTRFSSGYKVWETEAKSRHWGGISIVWMKEWVWEVEGLHLFGPNLVSFTVTSGKKRWYVVGAYVPPNNFLAVQRITYELAFGTEGLGKMLVGDLNACLSNPRNQREEHLATVIAGHFLTDQERLFVPRWGYRAEGN